MIRDFEKAAFYDPLDCYYRGPDAPFDGLEIPRVINILADRLENRRSNRFQPVKSMLLFGGAILDQKLGRAPKDYDVYLECPDLVSHMKAYLASGKRIAPDRLMDAVLGNDFPVEPDEDGLVHPRKIPLIGEFFGLTGVLHTLAGEFKMDLAIGTHPVDPLVMAATSPAPIMSCAVQIAPTLVYSYHHDFNRHADARLLVTDTPKEKFFRKAERKNLEVVDRATAARRLGPSGS